MMPPDINKLNSTALENMPESCGEVTVGCTDIAGIVEAVIKSSETLRDEHDSLKGTVAALEADQSKVAEASDEARLLSERAIERLDEGTALIQSSLGKINSLLDLVDTLGQHVSSFSAAMEQVRRSAQDIDDIAETTNILALNATIEAMRAGEAGRTFAVVADEVKSLANDTRKATEEITQTINTLGNEASEVIGKIEAGSGVSDEAKASVTRIEDAILNVGELVEEVDKQNDVIARSTSTISSHVNSVQNVLTSFDTAARSNEAQLFSANDRTKKLEMTANDMFDQLVIAGLSPRDSIMVDHALTASKEIEEQTQRGLEKGEIALADVFDQDYRAIPNSDPERFTTRLTSFADEHWKPVLNSVVSSVKESVAAVCADANGFMPTHIDRFAQEPTGDPWHDTRFCRNGLIIKDLADEAALQSEAPYRMSVFRQDAGEGQYVIVRSVYVPILLEGRRWGDFKLIYMFSGRELLFN